MQHYAAVSTTAELLLIQRLNGFLYMLYDQVPGVPPGAVPMGVPPTMMATYPVAMVCYCCAGYI